MTFKLDPKMQLGYVQLRVQSLETQKKFYQALGFSFIEESSQAVIFGAGSSEPILILTADKDVIQRPPRTTGLYHFAILVPSREDLAYMIGNLMKIKAPFSGAGDHLYSEAFYLTDPEGNGIEIYRDRPRNEWTIHDDGTIDTDTIPVDFNSIMALYDPNREWTGFPKGTILGHMHLTVSDLSDELRRFYIDGLGLDLKTNFMGSAYFMSAGDYHHHIATNVWNGIGAPLAPSVANGLISYSLNLSSMDELKKLKQNLVEHDISHEETDKKIIVKDFNHNGMIFTVKDI
ncbi:VOC family protein [Rummeliibacillus sp. TYF005]|uniref:VOC family protein n=1 Tax=Rummeliibacillus sp. TYF005 TaxID=2058214 RepID=UPI000F5202E7|nr:VOC family protein [Rummeliibacillus sp. TYF005]RPJ96559.1 VOC family protein [Rummeliibacillus sp. TYF005]